MGKSEHGGGDPLPTRVAAASIVGFWCFFLIIWMVRSEIIYRDHGHTVGVRILVSTSGGLLTALYYLALRRLHPNKAYKTLAIAIGLALPLAVVFSIVEWSLFWRLYDHQKLTLGFAGLLKDINGLAEGVSVGGVDIVGEESPLGAVAEKSANAYFFFVAWGALYLALRNAAQAGALERHAAELRGAAREAELRALRHQVNPHFLFNTLNSLSALVMSDRRKEAEAMIMNLSAFFRASMDGDPTEDVTLEHEIMLQRLYLEMETVRFPGRVVAQIDIPPELRDLCVPGLILQPLIENAMKHAVARSREPVAIGVTATEAEGRLNLAVEDDGAPTGASADSAGLGLANVRNRLQARFGDQAWCAWGPKSPQGFAVHLQMPAVRHGG